MTVRRRNAGPRNVARWYAKECGCIKAEVRKLVGKRHPPRTPRRALTDAEQRLLLRAARAEAPVIEHLLHLTLLLGLRVSEVCALQWRHICRARAHVFGKGQKWRWVPIPRAAQSLLSRIPRESEYLFPNSNGGHIAPSRVQSACRRIATETNLPLTPHVLRHTYATNAMMHCVPPQDIQSALGHDKFTTTLTYLHTLAPF